MRRCDGVAWGLHGCCPSAAASAFSPSSSEDHNVPHCRTTIKLYPAVFLSLESCNYQTSPVCVRVQKPTSFLGGPLMDGRKKYLSPKILHFTFILLQPKGWSSFPLSLRNETWRFIAKAWYKLPISIKGSTKKTNRVPGDQTLLLSQ